MEFSEQIKKYRSQAALTQDELAEKIYVSRQTISNWENDRSYPDVKSLLLLSSLFQVSLDTLVKGDLEEMKEQIKQEDIKTFNRDGTIFAILLLLTVAAAVPMVLYLGTPGTILWVALWLVGLYFANRVEKQKKLHDVQTYREIVAFSEGRQLDELEKAEERGKRPYQKVFVVAAFTAFAGAVAGLMLFLMK